MIRQISVFIQNGEGRPALRPARPRGEGHQHSFADDLGNRGLRHYAPYPAAAGRRSQGPEGSPRHVQ